MQAQRCVSAFRAGLSGDLAATTISHLAIFIAKRADWVDHRRKSPRHSGNIGLRGILMYTAPHPGVFTKRRIGLCGESSSLSQDAATFCEAVGEALISEPNVLLVTAGARGGSRYPLWHRDGKSADWHF